MAIDPKTAARIAKDAGLSLSDARAIAAMAEDEKDAAELAEMFKPDEDIAELVKDIPRRH